MQKFKKTNIWKMIDRHQKLKWMKPTFCFVKYKPMLISHGYAIYCLLLYYHSPYDTIVPVITSCMLPVTSGQGQDTSFYFGVVDFTPAGDLDRHVSCLSPGNILLVCTCHMWKRVTGLVKLHACWIMYPTWIQEKYEHILWCNQCNFFLK